MTKLIFMGTPDFSATVLKGLLADSRYEILAVVTQPDRKVGRKKEIRMTPVKQVALEHQLPVLQPEKLSGSPEMETLLSLDADGIVTAALINGDEEAGVTIMEMVKEMDAGDMIAARSLPILDEDNVGTLFEKLAVLGRDLLLDTLPAYLAGEIKPSPQDPSLVTFSPNILPEEEVLNWTKTNRQVFNQIRGMNPWPVAHTLLNGQRFKVYEAELCEGNGNPGEVIALTKKELVVAAGEGALSLKVVQPAGKPKMSITDFLNGAGRQLKVGDHFGS